MDSNFSMVWEGIILSVLYNGKGVEETIMIRGAGIIRFSDFRSGLGFVLFVVLCT